MSSNRCFFLPRGPFPGSSGSFPDKNPDRDRDPDCAIISRNLAGRISVLPSAVVISFGIFSYDLEYLSDTKVSGLRID